jgi:sugar-specific transcriptional regulator TrmB
MPKTKETLQSLGLEPQQIKIYLALLDDGEASASQIAERTGLGRVHIYQIAEKLIHKGFISFITKEKIKYFSAADPKIFLKDLQQKEEDLKSILPDLLSRKKKLASFETKVEVLRGKEGIDKVLKTILAENKDYAMLGGGEQCCNKEFELIMSIFVKRGEKEKLKGRLLERKDTDFFIGKHEDYRYIPEELLSSTTLTIWGNKVATFVWTKPYYVIILENEEVAKSNLATFNYLWKTAKKPTPKDRKKRIKF